MRKKIYKIWKPTLGTPIVFWPADQSFSPDSDRRTRKNVIFIGIVLYLEMLLLIGLIRQDFGKTFQIK